MKKGFRCTLTQILVHFKAFWKIIILVLPSGIILHSNLFSSSIFSSLRLPLQPLVSKISKRCFVSISPHTGSLPRDQGYLTRFLCAVEDGTLVEGRELKAASRLQPRTQPLELRRATQGRPSSADIRSRQQARGILKAGYQDTKV